MKLLFPDDACELLRRRYASRHRAWLTGAGVWPHVLPLGAPTERQTSEDATLVRAWVDAWSRWTGSGAVAWSDVQWPKLGRQRLPIRLEHASPAELGDAVGEGARFRRASARAEESATRWEALRGASVLSRSFDVLADYSEADYRRLLDLLSFLVEHPRSDLLPRQLPVEGIDTKWLETHRALVVDFVRALRPSSDTGDFFDACGLRRPPHRIRMRLLCPELRRTLGGLGDIEAPIDELGTIALAPSRALIVENLDTGLALPDVQGTAAFMKLGNSVGSLARVGWLRGVPAIYWGDIDTHGIAILDQARAVLGGRNSVTSILMDEATLLAHRRLWGEEASQHRKSDLPHLTPAERKLFDDLLESTWGPRVRLEQERIPWTTALVALARALA
jgi:hypothetical protein